MLLVKPYIGCNLKCEYCYQNVYRKAHPPSKVYDLKAVLKKIEEFGKEGATLHGGEILTLPQKDVEAMLAKSYELGKCSSIQTNGTLINGKWIKIFKKYKTNIGISWDGPGELSKFRPGTSRVFSIIKRLAKERLQVSLIIVISKANAGNRARLEKLKKFLLELDKLKINGRINPCQGAPECELSQKKLAEVYLELADFCIKHNLRWSPFTDVINGLKGANRVCFLSGCDPFSTKSATVILGDGSVTNCMRTNKENVLLKPPAQYKTRNEILENIPQKQGGCQGCPYWKACYGGCPDSALDNDWRNRTYMCPVWKALFVYFDRILNFCKQTEQNCLPPPVNKENNPVDPTGHGDRAHGDWGDSHRPDDHKEKEKTAIDPVTEHGDNAHGDRAHGDWGDCHKPDNYKDDTEHLDGHGDRAHGDWADNNPPSSNNEKNNESKRDS